MKLSKQNRKNADLAMSRLIHYGFKEESVVPRNSTHAMLTAVNPDDNYRVSILVSGKENAKYNIRKDCAKEICKYINGEMR